MLTEISHKRQLLNIIATRASSPSERLQGAEIDETGIEQQDIQEHLQRLYTVVKATDKVQQARFLAHLHLNEHQIKRALSLPVVHEETSGASWTVILEHILTQQRQDLIPKGMSRDRCLVPTAPMPFEELLLPFIHYAREQLMIQVPEQGALLSKRAQTMGERWLLSRLTSLAGQVLEPTFMSFRALADPAAIPIEQACQQRVHYERFLQQYAGEGLLPFFAEYSLLARLLIQKVEQWIEVSAEFLERLQADSDLIGHTFYAGQPAGQIVALDMECSDPHHHGRTVFLLTFADGRKLVYKPRCMDIDVAFCKYIDWFNEQGLSPDLRYARVLNRHAYGWMEYIEHAPCQTTKEVQSYYQRCGLLTCLFYALGSTDMHHENLIAHGAYPVPIDLETILTPGPADLYPSSIAEEKKLEHSVFGSGMLMMKMKVQDWELNVAALGDVQEFDSPIPYPTWRHINTDAMTLSYEISHINLTDDNKALFNGSTLKSSDHVEDLVAGFRSMYHFLIEHRDELLARGQALDLFADCPIRFLYRPTYVYVKQLIRLANLDFLQEGTDRWVDLQVFKRPLLQEQGDQRLWTIASAELASLELLDIPWFGTNTDSTHLFTDESIIVEHVFTQSALEQARSWIASLNDEDMQQQIKLIREAYAAV